MRVDPRSVESFNVITAAKEIRLNIEEGANFAVQVVISKSILTRWTYNTRKIFDLVIGSKSGIGGGRDFYRVSNQWLSTLTAELLWMCSRTTKLVLNDNYHKRF